MIEAGADIGGTSLRLRVEVDGAAARVLRRSWDGEDRSPERLGELLGELLEEGLPASSHPVSLGLAIAGQCDRTGRLVRNAPNLGWRDVPLHDILSASLPPAISRLVILNDLHAAALAEAHSGAARGAETALVVFLGTGIGGAVVIGGGVHRGASGAAGEIGHVKVAGRDVACGCGQRGCIEALAGGRALEAAVRELLPGIAGDPRPLARWQEAVDDANPAALRLVEERAELLGQVVANAATLVSPEVLVLGGGALRAVPALSSSLGVIVRREVLAVSGEAMRIETAHHGDEAGAIGALLATRAP